MTGQDVQAQLAERIRRLSFAFLPVLVALSLAAWDLKFTLGVAAGGLLATANFHLLHRTLKKLFRPGRQASVAGVVGRSYLRFIFTGVIILLLLKFGLVGPIGLVIGLSVIVLNLTLTGLLMARRVLAKEAL